MYVARPLVKLQTLQFIREFTLERSHINVIYVARLSEQVQMLLFIKEFILERNHINVMCVARHLAVLETLLFIGEFILKRNHVLWYMCQGFQCKFKPWCSSESSYWRETI